MNTKEAVTTKKSKEIQVGLENLSDSLQLSRMYRLEIPPAAKNTIQFALDWKNLQDYPNRAAMYLKQMKSQDFDIFKDASMDYAILSQIIDVLVWEFLPRKWDISEQLHGLTRVGRLGTLIILSAEKDRAALRKLMSECIKPDIGDYYRRTYNL